MDKPRPPKVTIMPFGTICECEKLMQCELFPSSPLGRKLSLIMRCVNKECRHFDKPYRYPLQRVQVKHA